MYKSPSNKVQLKDLSLKFPSFSTDSKGGRKKRKRDEDGIDIDVEETRVGESEISSEDNEDIEVSFDKWGFDQRMVDVLREEGVNRFFPIQQSVIPPLFTQLNLSYTHNSGVGRRDILISAPTGSGKSYCYLLPILQAMRRRPFGRLEHVILLPTRELSEQVFPSSSFNFSI